MASPYEQAKTRYEAAKKEMAEIGRETFDRLSKRLFLENADLESFSWTQYTPYFNDGNTCYFYVRRTANSITVNGVQGYDVESTIPYSAGSYTEYQEGRKAGLRLHREIEEFLGIFTKEDLETFFGDHAEITIERGSAPIVDQYEHD